MKQWKMALAGLMSLVMVEMPAMPAPAVYAAETQQETTAQTQQVKNGLLCENGKYYYYVDGQMQKGWQDIKSTIGGKEVVRRYYFGSNGAAYAAASGQKTLVKKIKGKYYGFDVKGRMRTSTFCNVKLKKGKTTVTYRYYFGSNGAAYAGKKVYGVKEIAVKKIKGKYYGFNLNGNMVKGTWVRDGKFYVFDKRTGIYRAADSKRLRIASKARSSATALINQLGKPKSMKTLSYTCYGDGTEMFYYYDNFYADIFKDRTTGQLIVLGVSAK